MNTQPLSLMTQTQARIMREAYTAYVQKLAKMKRADLADIYRMELAERGRKLIWGGPASKDEILSALVDLRYPMTKLNESIHVLYHVDGLTTEICAYCNPNPCPKCGALETCDYNSEMGPVVNGRHV